MQFNFNLFKNRISLIEAGNKMKEAARDGDILTKTKDRYAKNSLYNFKIANYWFKKYEQHAGKKTYLNDINFQWATEFEIYLVRQGLAKNSIANLMSRLKAILRHYHVRGYDCISGTGIVVSQELTTTVYITDEELVKLLALDLHDTEGFANIRDIFIFGCEVGLRFADLKVLITNPKRYVKRESAIDFFEIKTKKTGELVYIPISRLARRILDYRNWEFNHKFSPQYFNLSIKSICKRAGIDQEVMFSRTIGGERKDWIIHKNELVSTHTARRSFATNSYLSGMDRDDIMKITGHKTRLSFDRYIRCSNLAIALKAARQNFFVERFSENELVPYSNFEVINLKPDNTIYIEEESE